MVLYSPAASRTSCSLALACSAGVWKRGGISSHLAGHGTLQVWHSHPPPAIPYPQQPQEAPDWNHMEGGIITEISRTDPKHRPHEVTNPHPAPLPALHPQILPGSWVTPFHTNTPQSGFNVINVVSFSHSSLLWGDFPSPGGVAAHLLAAAPLC